MTEIPYWQQRQALKLKAASNMNSLGKSSTSDKPQKADNQEGDQPTGRKPQTATKNSPPKKQEVKRKKKKGLSAAKRKAKKALGVFYASQLMTPPELCEECDAPLIDSVGINPRGIVCHIVPKSPTQGCPSVGTHPQNRFFGCEKCHNKYDKASEAQIRGMRIFNILRERVAKFWDEIKPGERRRVPECLRPAE